MYFMFTLTLPSTFLITEVENLDPRISCRILCNPVLSQKPVNVYEKRALRELEPAKSKSFLGIEKAN